MLNVIEIMLHDDKQLKIHSVEKDLNHKQENEHNKMWPETYNSMTIQ